jgi:hypothetical protein
MVDVVVGVHGLARTSGLAQQLVGAVGDHLVGVHVGGRPRAGLEDVHHEVGVKVAVGHLLRRLDQRVELGTVEHSLEEA